MTEWRAVVGYEAFYEVSDDGEVRSLPRCVGARFGGTRIRKPKILAQFVYKKEYWKVRLTDASGIQTMRKVHLLVAQAFLGPRPEGMYTLHRDDDRSRNCLSNIYYGTPRQNALDAVVNGKQKPGISLGEKHGSSRLKERDIPEILALRTAGVTFKGIAAKIGVAEMTIQDVCKGKNWGWLSGIPLRPTKPRRAA